MGRGFESARCFANELDFGLQLDDRFDSRPKWAWTTCWRCRPIDRLIEERTAPGRPAAPRRVLIELPNPPGLPGCFSFWAQLRRRPGGLTAPRAWPSSRRSGKGRVGPARRGRSALSRAGFSDRGLDVWAREPIFWSEQGLIASKLRSMEKLDAG